VLEAIAAKCSSSARTVIAAIAIARRRALGTPTAPRFATPAGAINTAVQGGFGMPPDKRGIGPVGPSARKQ